MSDEKEFNKPPTAADVKVRVDAMVKAALDEAMTRPVPEVAEIHGYWNLYAYGPIQPLQIEGPFSPHQVIKINEAAYVVTVLALNPFLILEGGISAAHVLSDFELPYVISYQTANLSTWALSGPSGVHNGNLQSGQFWYTDVLEFTAQQEGLFEMNILARLLGAVQPGTAPHFAGFARWIGDLDPEALWPVDGVPIWHFELPVKFMVYA